MLLGFPSLNRAIFVVLAVLLGLGPVLISCGGGTPASKTTSGLKFRALVSQDVQATIGVVNVSPALIVINALTDAQTAFRVGAALFRPAMMVLSNNRQTTLAVSDTGTQVEVVNNAFRGLSGSREIVAIYERWFVKPLPSGARLNLPMSPHLEELFQVQDLPGD